MNEDDWIGHMSFNEGFIFTQRQSIYLSFSASRLTENSCDEIWTKKIMKEAIKKCTKPSHIGEVMSLRNDEGNKAAV